jgi:osmotically-inducible protein OsmY
MRAALPTLSGLAGSLALVVGCSTAPAPTPATARADQRIADRVSAALDADPIYYYRHVDVIVDDGVATLRGYVWSTYALYHAQQIARGVPGVIGVKDEMELEREGVRGGGDGSGSQ